MRKVVVSLLALFLALSLVACGEAGNDSSPEKQPEQASTEQNEPEQVDKKEEQKNEPHDTVVFTGSGDDIIDLDVTGYYYVFHITGNADKRHFSVKTYDSNDNYSELLVNTTDVYDGTTYDASLDVKTIEISAVGDWKIEVIDLADWYWIHAGDTVTGNSDAVFALADGGKTADIEGNAEGNYFAVITYDGYGMYDDLLVNTTDPYSGKVKLGKDATIVAVKASGDWSFTANK